MMVDFKSLIGETTEYDKKLKLEEKKPKSWCKTVSAFANSFGGFLSLVFLTMTKSSGLKMLARMLKRSVKLSKQDLIQYPNSPLNSIRKIIRL